MIFVTVGTHEQPFNRLIKKIDELKQDGTIERACKRSSGRFFKKCGTKNGNDYSCGRYRNFRGYNKEL